MSSESAKPDFMGKNGFVWWQGVVEDIYDPLKIGRVRVRVLGWHTNCKKDIPTEDLPWAHVVMPVNSAFVSGKGWSPTGIVQGAWVIGFYRDGLNSQEPVVFGTVGGINVVNMPIPEIAGSMVGVVGLAEISKSIENKKRQIIKTLDDAKNDVSKKPYELPKNPTIDPKMGYCDPDGIYPLISRMGEADTNRLARNEQIQNTIVEKKRKEITGCSTALYGSWMEPKTPYNAQYPFNHVYESQAGHVVEYDDTPGSERMHWYHCSGTFDEIHPGGSQVHKVVGNAWDITLHDKMILVKGNASFNTGKTLKIRMGQDLEIEVEGDAKMLVKGNMSTEVKGDCLQKVGGKFTMASESNMVLVAPRIDFNPEGENASSYNTFLDKARELVNGLMEKLSNSVAVSDSTVQLPGESNSITTTPSNSPESTSTNQASQNKYDRNAERLYELADPADYDTADAYVAAYLESLEEVEDEYAETRRMNLPTPGVIASMTRAEDQMIAQRSRIYVDATSNPTGTSEYSAQEARSGLVWALKYNYRSFKQGF